MEEVRVTEYDPRWPEQFDEEATGLREVFGPTLVALEHIGSTSVPGLAAKPIVDIQAVVRTLSEAEVSIPKLAVCGWEQGVFLLDPARRLYFKKYDLQGVRTHQLHVYEPDHPVATAHLLFRDYLRAHPEEAARYEALKRELARRFHHDRLAYNDAKTEYVESVLAKVRG